MQNERINKLSGEPMWVKGYTTLHIMDYTNDKGTLCNQYSAEGSYVSPVGTEYGKTIVPTCKRCIKSYERQTGEKI